MTEQITSRMCRVVTVAIPELTTPYWLGYCLIEGEHFRLRPIGEEADIDALMDEYKLTGHMTLPAQLGRAYGFEVVPVLYAVKLEASEALRSIPSVKVGVDTAE